MLTWTEYREGEKVFNESSPLQWMIKKRDEVSWKKRINELDSEWNKGNVVVTDKIKRNVKFKKTEKLWRQMQYVKQ